MFDSWISGATGLRATGWFKSSRKNKSLWGFVRTHPKLENLSTVSSKVITWLTKGGKKQVAWATPTVTHFLQHLWLIAIVLHRDTGAH